MGEKFHNIARAAVRYQDANLLREIAEAYKAYREFHLEPFTGADVAMAVIIEGFNAHKGATQ